MQRREGRTILLSKFQDRLKSALGADLEHATPANVREFVDQIQLELWQEEHPKPAPGNPQPRLEIPPAEMTSYEGLMRSFFVRALRADRDQSLIQLWILSLDLAYSGIEDLHASQMQKLFGADA